MNKKNHTLKISPHSSGKGWVAGIYTPEDELVKAGFETTKEAALNWGVTTIDLMGMDKTLSAPDAIDRKRLANLDS